MSPAAAMAATDKPEALERRERLRYEENSLAVLLGTRRARVDEANWDERGLLLKTRRRRRWMNSDEIAGNTGRESSG